MQLEQRNIIITGATHGLGFAIAKAVLQQGGSVALCARNADELEKATKALASYQTEDAQIISQIADVSNENDVESLMHSAIEAFGRIDGLICNAGIYGPKGAIEEVDWQAWKDTINTNLLGAIYCAKQIIPHMKKNRYGKIVMLSGGGATKAMPYISAYAASKAGLARFAEGLAIECADYNIDVNAVGPGGLNTRMLDEVLQAGPDKVGQAYYEQALRQQASGGADIDEGAALCAYLVSRASDKLTGKLISAQWDDWPNLINHLNELSDSDIFTLRRILPKERGYDWGDKP